MYILDTNIFFVLKHFPPRNFKSLWDYLDHLVDDSSLISVREVFNEVIRNPPNDFIEEWVVANKHIFVTPVEEELAFVLELMKYEENRNFIKDNNITKGLPVADPFILAIAKLRNGIVVTMEARGRLGARIPNVCDKLEIECISWSEFLNKENIVL